jgi:ribosomal-protein-serine acetyltransferase
MRPPREVLAHEDVTQRRWRLDDAEPIYRVVSESLDHLTPWMAWTANGYTSADAHAFLERCQDDWRDGRAYNYAITGPGDLIIGSTSLMARIGPGGLEIGYWLHPSYTGKGIMTRAVAALTAEAFRVGADRVEIKHDIANERSRAIPCRLGFVEVGRQPAQEPITAGEIGVDAVWRASQ